jgi:DNA-binding NarL/FixJ family response regulator
VRDLRHESAVDAGGRVTVMLAGEHQMDHARIRNSLERDGFEVVAEVADADAAVEAALRLRPQLCLLDEDMPGGGILAADRISLELPATRIALLSGRPEPNQLRDAILAGADGYLAAATSPERLTAALNGLIAGEAAFPRAMTGQLVREFRQFAPRPVAAPDPGPEPGPRIIHAVGSDSQPLPPRSRLRYVPRLMRHYRHRRRAGMPVTHAWMSARERMGEYAPRGPKTR